MLMADSHIGGECLGDRSSLFRKRQTDRTTKTEVKIMKKGIHPDYKTVTVKCACGATFETKSTADEIRVEICSKCHPFFTGRQKLVDTGGRVDRFKKRFGMDK